MTGFRLVADFRTDSNLLWCMPRQLLPESLLNCAEVFGWGCVLTGWISKQKKTYKEKIGSIGTKESLSICLLSDGLQVFESDLLHYVANVLFVFFFLRETRRIPNSNIWKYKTFETKKKHTFDLRPWSDYKSCQNTKKKKKIRWCNWTVINLKVFVTTK